MKTNEIKKLQIRIIKTDKCCFVKNKRSHNGSLGRLLFDGETPKGTFDADWLKISKAPVEIKRPRPNTKENYRMVLKAEFLEDKGFSGTTLGKMAPEIARSECMIYDEDECTHYWKDDYKHLSSLYDLKWDEAECEAEVVEFEAELFCEIPSIEEYSGMNYEVFGYYENSDPHQIVGDRLITKRAIDKIIYPSILLPSCHATMSSDLLYKIVRFHIKQNIDWRYADITSDYGFCFTVEKRIIEAGDFERTVKQENNRRSARTKCGKSVIFEMTHATKKYQGYTVLPSISAKSNKALKRKIDKYLKNLMEHINAPLVKCEHCNGLGVSAPIVKLQHPEQEQ